MTAQATGLTWDVHAAPASRRSRRPTSRRNAAAVVTGVSDAHSGKGTPYSPTPLLTTGQARGLADWVAAHDRNLTAVYITHGHGDHRLGQCVSGAGNGVSVRARPRSAGGPAGRSCTHRDQASQFRAAEVRHAVARR